MELNEINPYIRRAARSLLKSPHLIRTRTLLDYELIYVSSGMCDIWLNDKVHRYTEGDIILICPGVKNKFKNIDGVDFGQPHIHFDMKYDRFSRDRFISFKSEEKFTEQEKPMICTNIFPYELSPVISVPDIERFKKVFFKCIDAWIVKKPNYELYSKSLLCELLCMIFENNPPNLSTISHRDIQTEQIRDYIDENFRNKITLDSISKQFFINKYTLLRRFKDEYGISVIKYVNDLKLAAAKKHICDDNMTVSELSVYLGFESVYTFSRFFKEHTGISPNGYKKSLEN